MITTDLNDPVGAGAIELLYKLFDYPLLIAFMFVSPLLLILFVVERAKYKKRKSHKINDDNEMYLEVRED